MKADDIITNNDIFEYITNHIHIDSYDKLRCVSVGFNTVFNLKLKKYAEIINIKGCNKRMILSFIEFDAIRKYKSKKYKIIDKSRLYKYWYYDKYHLISKLYNRIIELNHGKFIEYLIALLYNSEYTNYRNLINIFDNIDRYVSKIHASNVDNVDILWCIICICSVITSINSNLKNYDNRDKYKLSYKYGMYKLNIGVYHSIILTRLHKFTIANSENERPFHRFNTEKRNKKLGEYIEIIQSDKRCPKYYSKRILELLNKK